LAIGGVGALWVIFRADIAALRAFDVGRGEVIYFFGCIAHALYTPLSRKLNRGESAVQFAFGVLVAGAIVLFIWGAPELLATPWSALPAIVWITLIYLSVFASSVTFVLLQYATLRLPSAKVMAYTYLTPSWVVLWQLGLGKGAPPIMILAGVALTVLALALLLKDQTRSAPAAQR
jgi:drug/metabolite transporter (DMT)-like permease